MLLRNVESWLADWPASGTAGDWIAWAQYIEGHNATAEEKVRQTLLLAPDGTDDVAAQVSKVTDSFYEGASKINEVSATEHPLVGGDRSDAEAGCKKANEAFEECRDALKKLQPD